MLVELALDDLLHGRGRFALDLRRGDVALLGQLGLGHFLARDVGRIGRGDLQAHVAAERLELLVAGDEVRLAIHLEEHADLAADVDVAFDQAFLRGAGGKLVDLAAQLLAQERDRLLRVAVGLGESLFAVEQAGAGLFAQVADHLSGNGDTHQNGGMDWDYSAFTGAFFARVGFFLATAAASVSPSTTAPAGSSTLERSASSSRPAAAAAAAVTALKSA